METHLWPPSCPCSGGIKCADFTMLLPAFDTESPACEINCGTKYNRDEIGFFNADYIQSVQLWCLLLGRWDFFFVIFLMKDTHFTLVGDEISTALDQLSLQCCHSTGDGFNSLKNCVENWLFKRPSVEWFCVLNLFVWNDDFVWEKEEREREVMKISWLHR